MQSVSESQPRVSAASQAATIPCFDPATQTKLGEVPVMERAEVLERLAKARAAQEKWRQTSFAERRRVLDALLRHVVEHCDELCEVVARDAGKTRENALMGEIWPICEKLRYTMQKGEKALRPRRVSSGLLVHKRAWVQYEPLGVVGVICPWNFPLQNVMGPTIPALFAGNAVLVKVSEWTSWSAARFQAIFDEVLSSLGHPKELVQILTGYGDTGAALVSSGVDLVIFTGSVPNGRKIIAQSAETLTPVILELGGKDPMIVCDDADLEQAAHAALAGTMIASGQMCLAAERIFVMEEVYEAFVEKLQRMVAELRQGPPLGGGVVDVGSLTTPRQLEVIESLVRDAVAKGARLLAGGKARQDKGGCFFEPTLLEGVDEGMAIFHEATFGPVLSVIRVASEDEAIRRANASSFGLGSSVFSRSRRRAESIASRLQSGSSCINDFGMAYMAQDLPFGGVKASGFGRLNGAEGLRACCNAKSVLSDRLPLHQAVKLYPTPDAAYARTRRVIRWVYGKNPLAKLLRS